MKCKFCQEELAEGVSLCPACGQENTPEEMPAKKKMTSSKLAVIYICIIMMLAALVAPVVVNMMNGDTGNKNNAYSGGVVFADGNKNDVTCKGSYTVSDKDAEAKADKVIATAGDAELTNGMLQSIYWLQVYNFMSSYGSDYGIDATMPLDQQLCTANQNNWSWQQYFLDVALQEWQMYNAFCQEAEAVGYESTVDFAAYVEEMRAELEKVASSDGFPNAEQMVLHDMGRGASLEDYLAFLELSERGYDYYGSLYATIVPTEEQIVTYFEENIDLFEANGISDDGSVLVDVRHILLQPADLEDEQSWLDCEKEAQALLDQWLAGGGDEASFAALANEHSIDGGSNTNGGLYQYVQEGQMVEAFNDWCFDENRQVGDYGIVKTSFGYHLMFCAGRHAKWHVYAEQTATNHMRNQTMEALMEKYPAEIKYSKIVLGAAYECFGN